MQLISTLAIAVVLAVLGAMLAFAAPPEGENVAQETVAEEVDFSGGPGVVKKEAETVNMEAAEKEKMLIGPAYAEINKKVEEYELSLEEQRRRIEEKGPSFAAELKQFDDTVAAEAKGEAIPEKQEILADSNEETMLANNEEETEYKAPDEANTGEVPVQVGIPPETATATDATRGQDFLEENEVQTQAQEENPYEAHNLIPLGSFRTTAYCPCSRCNGKWTTTATGVDFKEKHTVAVDPRVIPLGSKLSIDGEIYVAEDTGGAIKGARIDVFYPTHHEARNYGVKYKKVYLVA